MRREYFNTGWKVQNVTGVFNFAPSRYEEVTLPHDAAIGKQRDAKAVSGSKTGFFPSGSCEYVKTFFVPEDAAQKRITFEFEGCYNNGMVYLNGQFAGQCPYGYSNFYVKADSFLKYGSENEIKVIARNNDDSRWYSGLGLYRNVRRIEGNLIHTAVDGLKITTRMTDGETACVEAAVEVENEGLIGRTVRVRVEIISPDGEKAAADELPLGTFPGECSRIRIPLYVKNPKLWDVDSPQLYQCRVTLLDGDNVPDEEETMFGIRTLQLDPFYGLRINGKSVKLRGACIHHDNGVIGGATIERAEERRIEILKKAGFNAIRSAHHPASKAMLSACDRLGMLVMDECFDMWTEQKSTYDYSLHFPEWWEKDITNMVNKDYNHPSVILYSIGNEIPDIRTSGGNRWGRRLAEKFKELDPGRYTLNSINGMLAMMDQVLERMKKMHEEMEKGAELNGMMADGENPINLLTRGLELGSALEEPCGAVDIAGYNYMTNRYEEDHEAHPNRILCGSETFSRDLAENWALVKKHPYLLGDFCWTGWDYLGEAGIGRVSYGEVQQKDSAYTPYPWYLAYCGDIDILGCRRPVSYYKEIVFGLRKVPYIAVLRPEHYGEKANLSPWSWSDSVGSWSFSGMEGKPVQVEVYADGDEVELLLNGKSVGRNKVGEKLAFRADFELTYEPGELKAVVFKEGKAEGETVLHSAKGEVRLHVEADRTKLKADTTDLAYLMITIQDADGNLFYGKDCMVTVQVEGCGCLQGIGSAQPCCEESTKGTSHTTYDGTALAVVRPESAGVITVTVHAEGVGEQKVVLQAE